MAIATNTTEGDILIAGDLDPTSTGEMPLLRGSGVTPGAYNYQAVGVDGEGNSIITITNTVIDPKGRITYAKSENYTITSVVATSSTFGIVKVDGTSVTVSDGVISFSGASIPLATSTTLGKVRPDNLTIFVDTNGVLTFIVPKATSTILGGVKYDNVTTYSGIGGAVSTYITSTTNFGIAKPDNVSLKLYDGKLGLAIATNSSVGILQADNETCSINTSGILHPAQANSLGKGIVRPDNTSITIQNGIISVPVVYATSSTVGIVKADENTLNVGSEGTLSLAKATSTTKGLIRPDDTTVEINSEVLSVKTARSSYPGLAKPDDLTVKINLGILSLQSSTPSLYGVVKPDNSSIKIVDGKLQFSSFITATSTILGAARGDNSSVLNTVGVLSVPNASNTTLGLVKPDADTILVNSGVLSHALPETFATAATLGLVKPDNTSIAISDGVLTANKSTSTNIYAPDSPFQIIGVESTIGIVKPDNTSIAASGGVINLINASNSVFGAVKPDNVTITCDDDGILSTILTESTTSVNGFVKLDNTIIHNTFTSNNHVRYATTSDTGLVGINPLSKNLSLYLGEISDTSVSLDSFNAMPDPQTVSPRTISGTSTKLLDVSGTNSSNIFIIKGTSGTLNVDGFVNSTFVVGTALTLLCQEDAGCTITFSTSSTTGFGGFFSANSSTPITVDSDSSGFSVIEIVIVDIGGLPFGVQVNKIAYSGIRI